MCLSTVYDHAKQDDRVLMKNVRLIEVNGNSVTLTDILESTHTFHGTIQTADLINGYVVIDCVQNEQGIGMATNEVL
ncbi:MAG: CooT family nickel-binding protein [Clostridia bacterium]